MSIFSRKSDWEWSQICRRPLRHAHRRRQRQPGRVQQVGTSYFKKTHMTDVLCTIFSREIDWEWSHICQRPLSHAHRRRQRQPGRVPQVPYMFLMILTNSLSCFHWLSSSTSMGVSMTPNRVQTYFSVYNPAPRAGPENFIITYILKPSVLCSLRKFLPQIR